MLTLFYIYGADRPTQGPQRLNLTQNTAQVVLQWKGQLEQVERELRQAERTQRQLQTKNQQLSSALEEKDTALENFKAVIDQKFEDAIRELQNSLGNDDDPIFLSFKQALENLKTQITKEIPE